VGMQPTIKMQAAKEKREKERSSRGTSTRTPRVDKAREKRGETKTINKEGPIGDVNEGKKTEGQEESGFPEKLTGFAKAAKEKRGRL